MILKIIRFLRGYVSVFASGKFTERLINILNKNGFLYWDIIPKNGGLTLSMPVKDYKRLRFYLNKTGIKTRVQNRYGLPFLIRQYRGRVGLFIGAILFVLLLSLFSKFIWIINVSGNKEIPTTEILSVLRDKGVYSGAYTNGIDVKATGRKVIEELPEIRWISINITSCKAEIEVKEKYQPPKKMRSKKPCNIKAKKDALVVKTNVLNGTKMVKKGSAVIKGQLLVSGVMVDAQGNSRIVPAEAEIFGRTHYEKTFKLPKKRVMPLKTGETMERRRANLLWFSFPVDFDSIPWQSYYSVTKREVMEINKTNLPLFITREYISGIENKEISLKENKKSLKKYASLWETFCLKGKDIEKRENNYFVDKNYYYMNTKYTVVENIAETSEIIVQ